MTQERADFRIAQILHDEAEPQDYDALDEERWARTDEQMHYEREDAA